MKNLLSIIFLTLLLLCPVVSNMAQKGAEQQKPGLSGSAKSSDDDRKSQNPGVATSLSAMPSPESVAPGGLKAESTEDATNTDTRGAAQKYYESGISLSEVGKLDEAISAFKQSLKIKPEDPQTNFSLGLTYSKSKAYKEAFDYFKRATQLKPDWPEAHFRLGTMSYVLGRSKQANEEYTKLQKINSLFANTLYRIIKNENTPDEVAESLGSGNQAPAANLSEVPSTSAPETQNRRTKVSIEPASRNDKSAAKASSDAPQASPTNDPDLKVDPSNKQALTEIYRVGTGDVLDVRLLNTTTSRSTLFTVFGGGLIDLPVAGGPISVAGMTAEEIQTHIAAELKRRAIEEGAQVAVGVRQYASHAVVITGLVNNPGTKFLRREAVPLYVILAEALLRPDAGRLLLNHSGSPGQTLDLSDPLTLNINVVSGDVVTISGRPQEFYYIAGRINYPGQKIFQPGITLLQAVLAAGGLVRPNDNAIEVSREGAERRLITTRFNIKAIKLGKVEDPKLQPGDRIEVLH